MKHAHLMTCCVLTLIGSLLTASLPAEPPAFQMVVPGFTVKELPIKLTSLNNIEYSADGRLFAGGYDGRFHLLRDSDGDGLEDRVETFSPEKTANYPLGISVKDGVPYFILTDEVVRFIDTNGDRVPDKRETVVKGFDEPGFDKLPYLHHRRVDSSMALAHGPDGSLYLTMGNAGFSNPYWHDDNKDPANPRGEAHYTTDKRRGCLLRITPDGKVEQLASGLRYVMSLQFNKLGDLFATDQEGATWCPNGNPFDELLHLEQGRHYGFPPRHPKWLPNVVDEPSVFDYAPQHQSTCGFRFNGPMPGRARFGPAFWADDAIVTGESRGKLWRTSLAKTAAGYVATNQLIAASSLLLVDCAISPTGDLVVCCHTGPPDWGNGPNGEGRLFKISANKAPTAQPVFAWPLSPTQTLVTFDRQINPADWKNLAQQSRIEAGRYVGAAEKLEAIRPGYAVVQLQQKQVRQTIPIEMARVTDDGLSLLLQTPERTSTLNYALSLPNGLEMAHDLSGVSASWLGRGSKAWIGWLPHADLAAARQFTRGSQAHDKLWQALQSRGTLELMARLDLWQMLTPATQPLASLGYTPPTETVSVTFNSDAALTLTAPAARVEQLSETESRLTVSGTLQNQFLDISLQLATPATKLDIFYNTTRDPRPRALPARRILMPFATPASADISNREIPEIAGGNYEAGHALFKGKAACVTCHQLRGEGVQVGADLGNLTHRDYQSVLRDITQPSATINPDAIGYNIVLKDGRTLNGVRSAETETQLHITKPGGEVVKLAKAEIEEIAPMSESIMPAGIEKLLTRDELRDLMTYLLTEPRAKKP